MIDVLTVKPPKGWVINELWRPSDKAATRTDFVDVPMLIGNNPGRIIEYEFEGIAVGLAVASGPMQV